MFGEEYTAADENIQDDNQGEENTQVVKTYTMIIRERKIPQVMKTYKRTIRDRKVPELMKTYKRINRKE
jgi:hypothetical protein